MKIAISSTGRDLQDQIDPRFGRCSYFLIVNPENMECEAIDNPGNQAMGGAGTAAAQALADRSIDAVVTGDCGPKAFMSLQAAGIKVFTGAAGTVREAVEQYKGSSLNESSSPTTDSHTGLR